jgi:competence protein ComEA
MRTSIFILMLTLACTFATAEVRAEAPKGAPSAAAKADPAPAAKAHAAGNSKKDDLLDINTATEAELKGLDGIGDAYSKKIVEGRPYAKKDQLLSKKIVPQATYEKIKDKIIAKQRKK